MTPGKPYRLTDVLWWTRQADVLEEIADIMDLEAADTNTPGWFAHRMQAMKNILDRMSEEERRELKQEAERLGAEGLPEDVQRK